MDVIQIIRDFLAGTGIASFFAAGGWKNIIMICIAVLLLYLAIFKDAEPYLLIPIGFGMLLVNLPGSDVYLKTVVNSDTKYTYETLANYCGLTFEQSKSIFTDLGLDLSQNYSLKEILGLMVDDGSWTDQANAIFASFSEEQMTQFLEALKSYNGDLSTVVNANSFAEMFNITVDQANAIYYGMKIDLTNGTKISEIINKLVTDGNWNVNGLSLLAQINAADFAESEMEHMLTLFTTYEFSGLLGVIYLGVKKEIYPCLIFLGIGATTDFGPLIANPKSMILGAAAQIGIFITLIGALLLGFNGAEAASIGIIGGADGPTAILTTTKLAPHLLSGISVAAYSYMALVPFIQPPIIRLLTTKKERQIKMTQLREVSQTEKIIFPIVVTLVVVLLIPSCAPLVGTLMLGNLIKESGVVPKLTETAGNALLYIVTILLGTCVGATASADNFLTLQTLKIFALGIIAFSFATAAGVLFGKIMCKLTHGKVNPMIGAAGVSAVPMAARVVHKEGVKEDPTNFLLMHAMGPNVAGVIGSAIAAGILINFFG